MMAARRIACALLVVLAAASCIPGTGKVQQALEMVVRPQTHDRHLRNPGMGLIFYGYRSPPPEYADLFYVAAVWFDVEKEPGRYDWTVKHLGRVFKFAEKHHRQVALRLVTSWQNYETPIPRYLLDKGVRLFPHQDIKGKGYTHFVEPEWWHPEYRKAYLRLIRAFGKRFDGDPRIAWIDMRYYGFWNEGHRYGATVPWPAGVDKRELLKEFIDVHFEAFKKTPLVVQTASDKGTPYPAGTAIDYALQKGAWMRRDGFGPFVSRPESQLIKGHRMTSLLVAENAGSLRDFLALKIRKRWIKDSKPITIDQLVDQMLEHHVNYFPLGWGWKDYQAVMAQRPDLVKKASLQTGYRMIVTEARWPRVVRPGAALTVSTVWKNTAVGRLPFPFTPALYLLDMDGRRIARATHTQTDMTQWVDGQPQEVPFQFTVPARLPGGKYAVAVAVEDADKKPVLELGIEGGDAEKVFRIGEITVAGQ